MGVKLKIDGIDLFEDGSMLVNVTVGPKGVSAPLSDPVTMKFNLSDNTIVNETLAEGDESTMVRKLPVLQLPRDEMPAPVAPIGFQEVIGL